MDSWLKLGGISIKRKKGPLSVSWCAVTSAYYKICWCFILANRQNSKKSWLFSDKSEGAVNRHLFCYVILCGSDGLLIKTSVEVNTHLFQIPLTNDSATHLYGMCVCASVCVYVCVCVGLQQLEDTSRSSLGRLWGRCKVLGVWNNATTTSPPLPHCLLSYTGGLKTSHGGNLEI